ncbi:PKD domain-containing protein [bacterium]|nr:PKD domain-containing protein [bacterium]
MHVFAVKLRFTGISLLLGGLLISGCGGGAQTLPLAAPAADGFGLVLDPDPQLGELPATALELKVAAAADQAVVSVQATGTASLKYFYGSVNYDPACYTPVAVEHRPVLGGEAGDLLTLDISDAAGVVELGQLVAHPDRAPGYTGTATLVEIAFDCRPFTPRAASAPPQTAASATRLNWDPEQKQLSWGYYCQGDYNQDGLVSVHDLTPLGVHYLEEGPFDEDSALAVVDGNSDGLVTVNDITPIGQNFSCNVEGYVVFADGDPGQLPPANDSPATVDPYDYVPFSAATGDKQVERLGFARDYPELSPDVIVWVRPVGEDLFGTPSWPQIPGLGIWQVTNISSFATAPGGPDNTLLEVDGLPAVCYRSTSPAQLVYQRALDPVGNQWGSEVVVDAGGDQGHFCSMRIVAGNPAIAYYDWSAQDLKYCRANDALGTTWALPVTIASTGNVGYNCKLIVANGNPAIAYQDLTDYSVKFVRASNGVGSSWNAPVTVANNGAPLPPGTGTYISAALVGVNPAIAYFDNNSGDLHFIRAGDVNGQTWGSYVKASQSVGDSGRYCSLFMVDGRPALAYLDDGALAYVRAADAPGNAWGAEITIDSGPFNAAGALGPSLCVNNGKPALSYYSGTTAHDLMYARAVDAAGANWAAPYSLDGPDQVGSWSCLTNIGTNPAISYYDETNDDLKFAILVNANNQAPTAQLAVDKANAKVGQHFEFNASASTDGDGAIVLYEWDWEDDGVFEQSSGTDPIAVHGYETAGAYTPHVRVTDNDGGQSSASVAVVVAPNEPPEAGLTATPTRGNPPFTISFDASGSYDPDGTIINHEWDGDGDGHWDAATDNVPYWSWVCTEPGEFEARVRVTDDSGDFGFDTVLYSGNVGPIAIGTATPDTGSAPFSVTFDSTGSHDPDGSIDSSSWDIHDDGTIEHTASGVGTWTTTMIWAGAVKVRLRVQDNEGLTGSMLLTVNSTGGWHLSTLDSDDDVGWYNSLALCNGKPGVSYFDYTNGALKYIRAQDAYGYAWYQSQSLGTIVDTASYACYGTSLAWVNGTRAAIVQSGYHPSYPNRHYLLASNVDGNAWNPFTAITSGVGAKPDLQVVNGNPAYVAYDGYDLTITRASDTTGTAWNTPVTIASSVGYWSSSTCALAIVGGNPAVAYCQANGNMSLWYVRCGGPYGVDWTTPVLIDDVGDPGETVALAMVNGRPAVAYVATESGGGGFEIRYKRAGDDTGSIWPSGYVSVLTDGREVAGLGIVNGNPAIGGRTCTNANVVYLRAGDANGNTWPAATVVDNSDANLGYGSHQCDMLVINDHPAISYCHSVDSALKYAVWE